MKEEQWRQIKGFPKYQISNKGNVRNSLTEKHLKKYRSSEREYVTINCNGNPTRSFSITENLKKYFPC